MIILIKNIKLGGKPAMERAPSIQALSPLLGPPLSKEINDLWYLKENNRAKKSKRE